LDKGTFKNGNGLLEAFLVDLLRSDTFVDCLVGSGFEVFANGEGIAAFDFRNPERVSAEVIDPCILFS